MTDLLVKIPLPEGGFILRRRFTCPWCHGHGFWVNPRFRRQDPTCLKCKGQGWLPARVCENCGRPAWDEVSAVPNCGDKKCVEALKTPALPEVKIIMPGDADFPYGWCC